MLSCGLFLASLADSPSFCFADEPPPPQRNRSAAVISAAEKSPAGFLTHRVQSPRQTGDTTIRVLLPDRLNIEVRYPVIYVLPVEAKDGARFGDGLLEIKKLGLHNQFEAIFVAPSFSDLPWYADHPTDARIGQESYFVQTVVPFIEQTYPVLAKRKGRLLLGFSKSGWGAWSLLLRHPAIFGRAAAWDAPLMMQHIGKFGNRPIFGTEQTFAAYRMTDLLRLRAAALQADAESGLPARLILIDQGNFSEDHQQMRQLLLELKIPHVYHDGLRRRHDWHSGWVPIAVALLLPGKHGAP